VKDRIGSGGEHVYCAEVESAISSHPAVLEVAVFGVPDDRWVEAVHATVVLRDPQGATADELVEHCRDKIAGYKVPRSVELRVDPLPKSGAGKILKRELREPHWKDRETNVV
jgi:long-chain acyl-CoA synthetase